MAHLVSSIANNTAVTDIQQGNECVHLGQGKPHSCSAHPARGSVCVVAVEDAHSCRGLQLCVPMAVA